MSRSEAMRRLTLGLAAGMIVVAAAAAAQDRGIHVRAIRVLASDPDALLLEVPDLDKAIDSVKASGGSLLRPIAKTTGLLYAFVKDPDGNQIELLMPVR
jgi:predicted enzyme related to lactoylglutathione lyase